MQLRARGKGGQSQAKEKTGSRRKCFLKGRTIGSYVWLLPSLRFRPDRFNWPLFLAAFKSPCGTEAPQYLLSVLKPARGSRSAIPLGRDMFKLTGPEAEPCP